MTFDELRKLKDNWDGAGANAPTPRSIDVAETIWKVSRRFKFSEPDIIAPTTNGTVSLEWWDGTAYLEFEVDTDGHIRTYASFDDDK